MNKNYVGVQESLKRLNQLIGDAGKNYYERAKLCCGLLDDDEWIAQSFASNAYSAAEMLEDKYLHDLSGSVSVWDLLQIVRKFPEESQWKLEGYHLQKLLEKSVSKSDKPPRVVKKVKVADYEKVIEANESLVAQLRQTKKAVAEKDSTVEELRKEIEKLTLQNERLRGRVEELERLVQGKFKLAS